MDIIWLIILIVAFIAILAFVGWIYAMVVRNIEKHYGKRVPYWFHTVVVALSVMLAPAGLFPVFFFLLGVFPEKVAAILKSLDGSSAKSQKE